MYTKNGYKVHGAPANWPFGKIPPKTGEEETSPESPSQDLVYEKPIRERRKKQIDLSKLGDALL